MLTSRCRFLPRMLEHSCFLHPFSIWRGFKVGFKPRKKKILNDQGVWQIIFKKPVNFFLSSVAFNELNLTVYAYFVNYKDKNICFNHCIVVLSFYHSLLFHCYVYLQNFYCFNAFVILPFLNDNAFILSPFLQIIMLSLLLFGTF